MIIWQDGTISYGSLEDHKASVKEDLRGCATCVIENKYPLWKQINISNGIYSEEYKNDFISFVSKIRQKTDEYDNIIDGCSSHEELLKININIDIFQ